MRPRSRLTLRGRLVIAFGLLGVLLSVAAAVGMYFAYETIEDALLEDVLERELAIVLQGGTAPRTAGTKIRLEHFLADAPSTPEVYRNLQPGLHAIGWVEQEEHILVKSVDGVRHVLVFQDERIEFLEETVAWTLIVSVFVAIYMAVWIGFMMSRRVISPVTALAAEVRGLAYDVNDADALRKYAEDEVGDLAKAFRDYRQRLQEFVSREQAFTGSVSHELRTPLTVIGNNVDVLLERPDLSDSARERLLRIRRAVRESADLVGAFLVLARRESQLTGECEPRVIVDAVARNAAEQLGVRAAVEVAADAPATLRSPAPVFSAVVRNLLHNAIVHGSQPVTVLLTRDQLTIADAGNGSAATPKDGRLGLDIVQRLCERQGWRLDVSIMTNGTQARVHFHTG